MAADVMRQRCYSDTEWPEETDCIDIQLSVILCQTITYTFDEKSKVIKNR